MSQLHFGVENQRRHPNREGTPAEGRVLSQFLSPQFPPVMASPDPSPDKASSLPEGPLSVLLIEDNPGDARLFEEYLEESSPAFDLRHELTLEAGLEALRGEKPDVLAVDLGLPDSEGAETVKVVTGAAPEVPIVVLTGQDDLEAALQAQEAGASEYIQKGELTPALAGRTLRWAAQRNRMQQKLRQRDAWIRSISENVAGGLFRAGPTGRIEYANRALARMLGFDDEAELIGRDLTEFYANPVQRGRMLAEEGAEGVEVEFQGREGARFIGLLSAEAAFGAEGTPMHYDGVVTDITEQKNVQRELARKEALTQGVLDALAANVAVLDGDGTIIEVNEQWEQFGRDNEGDPAAIGEGNNYLNACGEPSSSDVAPGDFVQEDLQAVIDGEKGFFEHEYPCHGPDEKRWFLLRATPLEREEGGAVVAHINVTERVQAVRQQRILSEAVEQAKESVLITEAEPLDEPGPRVEYVNAACEEMTGYSEEEIKGKTPRVLQGPETDREVLDSLRDALEAGEEWQGETVNYRKDGTPYRVQWNVAPVRGEDEDIEHWVSVQRDVTEKREREEKLRKRKALLEQAQRLAGAWEVDLRTGIQSWSEEVYRIHKIEPGREVSVEEGIEFYAPEARPQIRQAYQRCAEEGEPFDLELPLITAEGNRRWVRAVGGASKTKDGEVLEVAGAIQDITERKESRRQLKRQNDLFQKAQEIASVGAWEYDRRTETLTLTDQAYRVHGLDPGSDVVPERVHGLYHPEDRAEVEEAFQRALEEGESYDIEARLITEAGEERWAHTSGEPQIEEEGSGEEVIRIRGAVQNITEHKRREEELRQKTVQLEALFDQSPDMINVHEQDGSILLPNANLCHKTGYSEEQLQGMRVWDLDASVGSEKALELRAGMAVGEERRFEGRYQRKGGSTFPVEVHLRRLDLEGEERLVEISHDITERKRRVQVLRDRQQKLRDLYSATNRLLRATDRMEVGNVILHLINNKLGYPGGTVRFAEDGALQPSCVSEGALELMGERPPFDLEGDSAMAQVYRTGESVVVDDVRKLDDSVDYGTTRAGAAFPLGPHGVVGIAAAEVGAIDEFNAHLVEVVASQATAVLDSIEQLEDLRDAKEEAERMNRLKSAFLANMSHEIRTPLTSILGFAEAIGEQVPDEDEGMVPRFARLIEKSGRRLMDTLTGVLNLSKLEAGEISFDLEPIDLEVEAVEMVQQFRPQAEESEIDLQEDLNEVRALASEEGVRIVLRNLVSNAIKYTEEGGSVTVRTERREGVACIEVEDTGIGMDPGAVENLFDAFAQASEGWDREYEGSGLGLTLVEKTVERMNGSIEVETEKGEGSWFTVRLPRTDTGEGKE